MTETITSYQSVMGISTGDIITTSYGSLRYAVTGIFGPYCCNQGAVRPFDPAAYTIRDYPVIDLGLEHLDPLPGRNAIGAGINAIRQQDGRWFTDMGDEVFVTKADAATFQAGLFAPATPAYVPYELQDGVDYTGSDLPAWHCGRCGHDWNAPADERGSTTVTFSPPCPTCGRFCGFRIHYRTLEAL